MKEKEKKLANKHTETNKQTNKQRKDRQTNKQAHLAHKSKVEIPCVPVLLKLIEGLLVSIDCEDCFGRSVGSRGGGCGGNMRALWW